MARKTRKRTLPQWATRKAKAGSEEFFDEGRDAVRASRVGSVAKKLYLERRRSARIVHRALSYATRSVKALSKIRPSKMSQKRKTELENYIHAAAVLKTVLTQIQG